MWNQNSPGEKAGLQAGDKILEVDGKPVTRFSGMNDSVTWNVIRSEGETIPFRGRARRPATLAFGRALQGAEQRLAAQERAPGFDLSRDHAGDRSGAAEDAGRGRRVCSTATSSSDYDGKPIYSPIALADLRRSIARGSKPISLAVDRDGQELTRDRHAAAFA